MDAEFGHSNHEKTDFGSKKYVTKAAFLTTCESERDRYEQALLKVDRNKLRRCKKPLWTICNTDDSNNFTFLKMLNYDVVCTTETDS